MSNQKRKYELRARAKQQEETRQRIVQATVALHEEVGPAHSTVAEIARRAGVSRLTVYNHFPQEQELFAACQRSFLTEHPLPDYAPALALDDPHDRLQAVLRELYQSYRAREPMTSKVLRDRSSLPALDQLMQRTMDAQEAHLTEVLATPFHARGKKAQRLHAVIRLALDFSTWQRLKNEGLGDPTAAALMADLVACTTRSSR
jgi:AcrR family transcriptional regulator